MTLLLIEADDTGEYEEGVHVYHKLLLSPFVSCSCRMFLKEQEYLSILM